MRFEAFLLALSAFLGGCSTPRPEAAPACAPAVPAAPQPAAPEEPPVRPAAADPDFAEFGRGLVEALSTGNVEPYILSDADIDAYFEPAYAPIIKSGRSGWVNGILKIVAGSLLRYKTFTTGPDYALSREGLPEGAARVRDVRIEITVNGNPHTIVIGAMYGAGAAWKILKAEVFE